MMRTDTRRLHRFVSRRWGRIVTGLLVVGLVTGALGTRPAEAHLSGRHTVRIYGRMKMVDYDDIDADDVCEIPFSTERYLEPTKSNPNPSVTIELVDDCDEVRGAFRLVASLGSSWNPTSGFARVSATNCFFCSRHTVGQVPFNAGVDDNWFQRAGPLKIEDSYGKVTFDFTYVISPS